MVRHKHIFAAIYGLSALALVGAEPGVAQAIEVVEVEVLDTREGPTESQRKRNSSNNADGTADPGEWLGFRVVLRIPGELPEEPRICVTFDESFPRATPYRHRFEIHDAENELYLLDLSDRRHFLVWVKGKASASVQLDLVSVLTDLGSTSFQFPIREGDLFPPRISLVEVRESPKAPGPLHRPAAVGETVWLLVGGDEADEVREVSGRVLQLPDSTEVARLVFAPCAIPVPRGAWAYEAYWTVDRLGDFVVEATAEDMGGKVTTAVPLPGAPVGRLTTRQFEQSAGLLLYGYLGSLYGEAEYAAILARNRISSDLWDAGTYGFSRDVWFDYGFGQVLVAFPSTLDWEEEAVEDLAQVSEEGVALLIPSRFLFRDGVIITPEAEAVMREHLHSELQAQREPPEGEPVRLYATEEDGLFADLEIVLEDSLRSAIVPEADPGTATVTPLLEDEFGGIQAIAVADGGTTIYYNFDLLAVRDQWTREEVFLRALEHLLMVELPREPITAVVEQGRGTPSAFALQPNYPNPFNRGTVIGYEVSETGPVELTVYDVLGQRVAVLVREDKEAGTHRLTWYGRDAVDRPVGSGVYLCRLSSNGQAAVMRMLLLR